MPLKTTYADYPAPPHDALRFGRICDTFLRTPEQVRNVTGGIGTLGEKSLHAIIKSYLCEDTLCHEYTLPESSRMVADIFKDNHIFEVQTGSLYPLRKKVGWYLANTDYAVTVVHPISAIRYLCWIDPKDGSISPRRRTSKKGSLMDLARELFWLSEYVGHPRFSIRVLFLETEEYRMKDGWGNDGKRGSHRKEQVPLSLLGDVTLSAPDDYAAFLFPKDSLPDPFTAAQFSKAIGIRGRATYGLLHLLERLGYVKTGEKIGRGQGWNIVD
jgi:hypothetical protein